MKPLRRLFLLLAVLPGLLAFRHVPQGATEEILNEAIAGQNLIFNRKYDEAQKYFTKLAFKYPDSPLGSFGLMALYNAKMFENYDFSLDAPFVEELGRNQVLIEKILNNKDASAWDNFLCGASSGLSGFYFIRKDKAMAALKESSRAKKCLERALEKDPQFLDVYLGLGMYDYWRSVFTNSIKILPFFKDRRPEGIAQIQKAIDEGSVANTLARAALMFVYQQDGKSKPGLEVAEQLDKTYPNNVIVLVNKGQFLSRLGKHPEAQATLDQVLKIDPKISVALYFKALDFQRWNKPEEAKRLFEDYLKTQPARAWQAYAYYNLGHLALREGNKEKAMEYFKAGYKADDNDPRNLKMILKLRKESEEKQPIHGRGAS
jgi:Putative Zn-dependent protease, contains TPR repeats